MDLVSSLVKSLTSGDSLEALTGKTGGNANQVESVIKSAIPQLMSSMNNNASSKEGAESLLGALSQHKNKGSVTDQVKNADEEDGNKIINHILGGSKNDFLDMLVKETGLDLKQTNSILSNIAPALMSSVSEANGDNKEDLSSLTSLLGSLVMDKEEKDMIGGLKGNGILDTIKKAIL